MNDSFQRKENCISHEMRTEGRKKVGEEVVEHGSVSRIPSQLKSQMDSCRDKSNLCIVTDHVLFDGGVGHKIDDAGQNVM